VGRFLAALRAGDVEGLVKLLDPEVVVRADAASAMGGAAPEVRGAEAWARQAMLFSRGAVAARAALVEGEVGVVVAPRGRLFRVLRFTVVEGKIAAIEVIGDPERLRGLDLGVLED